MIFMNPQVLNYPLELVDILVVNETEARSLSGAIEPAAIYDTLNHRYPYTAIVLTMGHKGAAYFSSRVRFCLPAKKFMWKTLQARVTRLSAPPCRVAADIKVYAIFNIYIIIDL
jgi:sugar/nucleoside kinase (ribokinase family)